MKKLYKFISLSNDVELNAKKINDLKNGSIWFSTYNALNDCFEGRFIYNSANLLEKIYDDEMDYDYIIFNTIKNMIHETNVILSLTENDYTCMPMWAHYANNHSGFCVEYLFDDKYFKVNTFGTERKAKNVDYINEKIKFTHLDEIYDRIIKTKEYTDSDFFDMCNYDMETLFKKHISWSYENEYRIVIKEIIPFNIYQIYHAIHPNGGIIGYIRDHCVKLKEEILDLHTKKGVIKDINKVGLKISKIFTGIKCSGRYILELNQISNHLGCGNIDLMYIDDTYEKSTLLNKNFN